MKKREIDEAHEWTDKQLKKTERKLHKVYKEAQNELEEKWKKTLESLNKDVPKLQKEYEDLKKSGKNKEAKKKLEEYKKAFEKAKHEDNGFYGKMLSQITADLTMVNERALAYINDQLPPIFLMNYNYIGKAVEGEMSGHSFNMSFNLVNEYAVKELYKKLPKRIVKVAKDKRWNNKNINSQLMQGILQGESIPEIAERFETVVGMNERASVREARTLTTQAENLGRLESFKVLDADYGIINMKMWIATADDHTRVSHLDLDGEETELDEKFSNGLMFPADPDGEPAEVYNCRCTMVSSTKGFRNPDGSVTWFDYKDDSMLSHEKAIESEKRKRQKAKEEKEKKRAEKRQKSFNKEEWLENLKKNDLWDFEKKHSDWLDKLTVREQEGITTYTGSAYSEMNRYLRGQSDSISSRAKNAINSCTKALEKAKVTEDTYLRRGQGARGIEALLGGAIDDIARNPDKYVGVLAKDNGFHSCTPDPRGGFSGIETVIKLTKGCEGVYVAPISQFRSEKEFLLQRGTQFIVEGVDVTSWGSVNRVYMTAVGVEHD